METNFECLQFWGRYPKCECPFRAIDLDGECAFKCDKRVESCEICALGGNKGVKNKIKVKSKREKLKALGSINKMDLCKNKDCSKCKGNYVCDDVRYMFEYPTCNECSRYLTCIFARNKKHVCYDYFEFELGEIPKKPE